MNDKNYVLSVIQKMSTVLQYEADSKEITDRNITHVSKGYLLQSFHEHFKSHNGAF